MDLDAFLVAQYVLADDRWQEHRPPSPPRPGRPPTITGSEVLTLAIVSHWPRWRSERDFCRFADAHLRGYFPTLVTHGQLNRRIRALEPEMRAFHDERPVGEFLVSSDGHDAFLADKGVSSTRWARHWLDTYGAVVAATPQKSVRRAWPAGAPLGCR